MNETWRRTCDEWGSLCACQQARYEEFYGAPWRDGVVPEKAKRLCRHGSIPKAEN